MLRRQQPEEPTELEGQLDDVLAALDRGDHLNPNALQQASSDLLLVHRVTKRPVSGKFITLFMHALKLAHMCSRCFRFVQTLSFRGRWTKHYVLWSQTYNLLFFLSVSVLAEAQDGLVQEGRLPPPLPPRQPSVVREDNMLLIPQRQVGEEDLQDVSIVRQDGEVNVSIPANEQETEVIANLPSFQEPAVVRRKRQGSIAQTLTSAATFGAPPAEPKRNASRPRLNYRVRLYHN